jgi:ABC-type proline/glycine betaine transport system substrate-binding protein
MSRIEVETVAKKWGNSIGLIIPKDVADKKGIKENTKVRFAILENSKVGGKLFGLLSGWKEPTNKIMREIRKDGWDR